MTKPCSDINTALARSKGWKQVTEDDLPSHLLGRGLRWESPRWGYHEHPPDFCGDWKYAGPLLEELLERHGRMEFGHEFFMVHLARHGKHKGATLIEAIARAAEAMLEERR